MPNIIGFIPAGFLMFGFSTGTFKKPLLFLIPLSTALSVIFITDFVPDFHFERGVLITLYSSKIDLKQVHGYT